MIANPRHQDFTEFTFQTYYNFVNRATNENFK